MKREREEPENAHFVSGITGTKVPQSYFDLLLKRSQLPIASYKKEIQETVAANAITLLTGETGSGKTTQVPHYIAEILNLKGVIVCTQPRRVAAMSVAQRVSLEVGSVLGAHVGYNVRFDCKLSPQTRVAFYTDGMLLREFASDKDLSRFGAVIVDEAHERTVDTDLLLGLLKDLSIRRPQLRVIVMSATLDMETFKRYFPSAPLISVPGRVFPVDVFFADKSVPCDPIHISRACAEKAIEVHKRLNSSPGDILIFLPGESEIMKTISIIEDNMGYCSDGGLVLLALYGSMPLEEQSKVFEAVPPKFRKVICSTNIAETSLTIDGVVCVIDSCYHKQSLYNPKNRIDFLLPTLISKASAQQRAGRAGRTRRGECYRLITSNDYEGLVSQTYPEVMRCESTGTILLILQLGYPSPFSFPFVSPPPKSIFLDGYLRLSFLGAIELNSGRITDVGRLMSEFPTSVSASRAILKAATLGCSVDIAMIVSMLEAGQVFKAPYREKASADIKRASLIHSAGDHLTLFKVFHAFIANGQSPEWCKENYIVCKTLQQAVNIFKQLSSLMDRLKVPRNSTYKRDTQVFNDYLIRRALFEGYFVHTALHIPSSPIPFRGVREQQDFTLHPSSCLAAIKPKWVVYDSLEMQGGTPFARIVTRVEPEWFKETCPVFFDITEIDGISNEVREALKDLDNGNTH